MKLPAAVLLLAACGISRGDDPEPPVWPGRFHALLSQNRDGDLGIVDLWYDYARGLNLNIIQTQSGEEDGPLYDNERANGSTYYYYPAKVNAKYCQVLEFGVGIIKPDWLMGATYLGEEKSGIYDCYKWEQGEIPEFHSNFLGLERPLGSDLRVLAADNRHGDDHSFLGDVASNDGRFITYWSEKRTGRPVRWEFFDGGKFEVIRFDEGATADLEMFQIPAFCFTDDDYDPNDSPGTVDILPVEHQAEEKT